MISTRELFEEELLKKKKEFKDKCGINDNYYKQIVKRFKENQLPEAKMESFLIQAGWEKKVTWKKKK